MAIYILAPGEDQPIGSSGGITFQKSGTSFAIRNRAKPVLKKSPGQTIIRNRFEHVVSRYRFLNSMDKATWAAEAPNWPRVNSLGDSYDLDAHNLMFSSNINLINALQPEINNIGASAGFASYAFQFLFVENFPPTAAFINDLLTPIGFSGNVYASAPLSPGTTRPPLKNLPYIWTYQAGTTTNENVYNQYAAVHGEAPWPVGNIVYAAFFLVENATGQIGPVIYGHTFVT